MCGGPGVQRGRRACGNQHSHPRSGHWEFNGLGGRRVEVIADGLLLWHGAQLAIDTTLMSPLHGDGTARRGAANASGVALQAARRVKEATCPELSGEAGRARLMVSGGINFLEAPQAAPLILQGRVQAAYLRRWSSLLACSLARAFAVSLLELRPVLGAGEEVPPMNDVLRDARFQ